MHYLLIRELNHGIGPGDIIGALANQTCLTPDSIGNIEFDETFAEVEIYQSRKSYAAEKIESIGPTEVKATKWERSSWEQLSSYIRKYEKLVQLEREEEMGNGKT